MRKGYAAEYVAKKDLERIYGKGNVLKIAISQVGPDFIILGKPVYDICPLYKVVEVKETHGKKYYLRDKDKQQIMRIIEWCKEHQVKGELWVYTTKHGAKRKKIVQTLFDPSVAQFNIPYSWRFKIT